MLSIENEEQQETAGRWGGRGDKGRMEEEESGRPQLPWVGVNGAGTSAVSQVWRSCLFQVYAQSYMEYFAFPIQIDLPNCQITESRPPIWASQGLSGPLTLPQNPFLVAVLAVLVGLAVTASRVNWLFWPRTVLPSTALY